MDKVYKGTPKSGRSLCQTCSHGHCVKGFNESQEVQYCSFFGEKVNFPVASCNRWSAGNSASIRDMRQIAWVIQSRNRGTWGFNGEREMEVTVRPPGTNPWMPEQEGE